ncbi:hypothetical protein J3U21_10965 [Gilliamella sp. B2776]|uniref:hypothetical protein n=1 Tax=unclassified Gilliamella TaxID=2685620 RepID=UPI002269C6EE|nr:MULTISPECIES: hypothetical protein [unclassified Gilliamella]MCX8650784.1 hypothetical protein [Gilliamella sp. B2779]MCX8654237.1 hypothetical protein [Gilliamella sp. B2737]MCX8657108.1 hypothetical protein [Gilliamella sp. B2894]MCX8664897.1 hypothetical protein [Gilliamella sp. B2887]MCX8692672.1 hypothetical protein [Gilliamella sp. B2776]
MKKLFLISIFFSFIAYAKIDAPIGLTWGESDADVVSKYKAKKVYVSDDIIFYELTEPPMTLPNFDSYMVLVHKDLGLMKVVLREKIKDDPYGTKGKEEYFKYKKVLTKKYGKPESIEKIGLKLYKEIDEFYQCLKYTGCGSYSSYFAQFQIGLEIEGSSRGQGELQIIYESDLHSKYREIETKQNQMKIEKGL